MRTLTKKTVRTYVGLLALIFVASLTYLNFQNFQPKILKQIQDVKGARTTSKNELPYPLESTKISETKTAQVTSITFRSRKTSAEIQAFYKNIYLGDDWKIESEKTNGKFLITKYKKGQQMVTITSSEGSEDGLALGSVDVETR